MRHRIKNYASPDCGAKVLAANPGATSAGNVLSPGRDEYMLNSCDTRVWFVVELCEGIQASRVSLGALRGNPGQLGEFGSSARESRPAG